MVPQVGPRPPARSPSLTTFRRLGYADADAQVVGTHCCGPARRMRRGAGDARVRRGRLRRNLGRRDRRGAGREDGQVGRAGRPGDASRRPDLGGLGLDRLRAQGGDRRTGARVLPSRVAPLRSTRSLEVADARGIRQPRPGHGCDRRREPHDVDLRAARRRAGIRGADRRAQHPRRPRRMARPRERRRGCRRPHPRDHDPERQALQRAHVHRRRLRRRPDGGGRRKLRRRARGQLGLRRELQRRAEGRTPSRALLPRRRQPLRQAGRSVERPRPARAWGRPRRERRGTTSASRPTATGCA